MVKTGAELGSAKDILSSMPSMRLISVEICPWYPFQQQPRRGLNEKLNTATTSKHFRRFCVERLPT